MGKKIIQTAKAPSAIGPYSQAIEANGFVYTTGQLGLDPETGEFIKGEEHYFIGEDRWEGNPIIILVNSDSASAADHFTMIMSGMENVTVMGFTEANGSAQGIGAAASGKAMLSFSNCLLLDKDGNVFIDSDTDCESGNDIDIRVPFDEDAVRVLFDEDGDYVMQKAVEQINHMK